MSTKILLYEDNEELRNSLSTYIKSSESLTFLAAFDNCENVLYHIKTYQPDVIISDIHMPGVDGMEGLKKIRSVYSDLPVIMLTVFEDSEHIIEAIMNGASGYILKQHLATRLVSSIQEVLDGGAPMSPIVASLVLKHINAKGIKSPDYYLTPREKDILRSLTDGNSYKMIANDLGITIGTVTTHIKNVYEKLGVHSQSEAVSKTLRENLL